MSMKRGSLVVVGTGIQTAGQLTTEASEWIRLSEKVLYVVANPTSESVILSLNPAAESMNVFYGEGKLRKHTYRQMVDRVMVCVREGLATCMAAYGHPGIYARASHESIRRAREEGYLARMLPAVSAEDCLLADLGIDPGEPGCHSYEATSFLRNRRRPDPFAYVLLWQIGVIGEQGFAADGFDVTHGLQQLVQYLSEYYAADHEVIVYTAATAAGYEHFELRIKLSDLANVEVPTLSTLCIPPTKMLSD